MCEDVNLETSVRAKEFVTNLLQVFFQKSMHRIYCILQAQDCASKDPLTELCPVRTCNSCSLTTDKK